jgi:sugar phosphate isomerase/epimerase
MNMEEADPALALTRGLDRLVEIHLADSNRRGLGRGHLPLEHLLSATANFEGPFVMECTADADGELDEYLRESAAFVRRLEQLDENRRGRAQ